MAFKTQFPFRLPRGFVDEDGNVVDPGMAPPDDDDCEKETEKDRREYARLVGGEE